MKQALKKFLYHPLALHLDVDSAETVAIHQQILRSKKLMRLVYDLWYKELMRGLEPTHHLDGLAMVELGAGASFLEQYIPSVIKTDVVPNPNCAQVVDAEALPFADNSVRLFFLTAVLHHMHRPALFLKEAQRCLAPGGRIVMIEPANSVVGKVVTKLCNPYEFFDPTIPVWENAQENRMTNANLALPWVMLVRDRAEYDRQFPELPIMEIRRHTLLSYYVSGGMTYRSLMPDALAGSYMAIENVLSAVLPNLCVLMTVQLQKMA